MQNFYFYTFYFFGAGPSSAHGGWAGPSQPGPVTGPSQWPGGAEQHACANARVFLHCASELKFTCTEPLPIKLTKSKKERFAYLVWEAMKTMVKFLLCAWTTLGRATFLLSLRSPGPISVANDPRLKLKGEWP